MSDRYDVLLFGVACLVCFLAGALLCSMLPPCHEDNVSKIVYVVEGGNLTLADGVFDPRILGNVTLMESGGILVVDNLSMLEAFK